jgi:hypothetical protein
MFQVPQIVCRSLTMFLSLLLIGVGFAVRVQAQNPTPSPTPIAQRRPLPKPPTGARGFEKYAGGDSSQRGIAAGATRGVNPRRPVAPLEGSAYEPTPFFAWEIEPGSRTYHFTLFEGDVVTDATARIVYQTDVTVLELSYPKDAPKLEPGKLYSWRVSTPSAMGKEDGPVARIMILKGPEAAEIKQALTTAGLSSPKTHADKLDQARVFENFGIWYDALRIASELAQDPADKDAQAYYDALLDKLDTKQEP